MNKKVSTLAAMILSCICAIVWNINAIVGFVLIFILLIMLKIGSSILIDWWKGYGV